VKAFIEIICDFENPSLYLGKVTKDDPVTKSTFLVMKNPDSTEILDVTTSSEFIKAELTDFVIKDTRKEPKYDKQRVEITALPGLPLGRINETVTLKTNLPDKPTAVLRLSGSVIGDIEVSPEWMTFVVNENAVGNPASMVKKVFINNHVKGTKLEILEMTDSADNLELTLKPLANGTKYELTATLKAEAVPDRGSISGNVLLTTNFPGQRELAIRYSAVRRSRKDPGRGKPPAKGKKTITRGKRDVAMTPLKPGEGEGMFAPGKNDPFAAGGDLFDKTVKESAGKADGKLTTEKDKSNTSEDQEKKPDKDIEATKG
jgi:hypothetical protein